MVNKGELRKAMRIIDSFGVAPLSDEIVAQHNLMHPKRTETVKMPSEQEIKEELRADSIDRKNQLSFCQMCWRLLKLISSRLQI